jgi:hypothetical protein
VAGKNVHEAEQLAINREGAAARRKGESYHANPHYFADLPMGRPGQFDAWFETCSAWAGGWLREDAGRTKQIGRALSLPGCSW